MTSGNPRRAVDEPFTVLPYRRMAEAALARAQDFNVSHADFRFERIRSQYIRVRDGRLQGATGGEDLAEGRARAGADVRRRRVGLRLRREPARGAPRGEGRTARGLVRSAAP